MSWGKVRAAVEDCKPDHRHVACVVHHVWSARDNMWWDEWVALRDYASRALSSMNHDTINLGDVVTWMCAEGEQGGQTAPLSFRVQWAFAVIDFDTSPVISVGIFVVEPGADLGWRAYDVEGENIDAWVVIASGKGLFYTPVSFGTEFLEAHL
ncbi:MAG: hypothetical protein CL489_07025 [Acidobacteria bacterium]|nr:hypothetical protein [Acidobacteriota bacterium]